MDNKEKKEAINRLLGRRKRSKRKPKIEPKVTPFPVRFNALGKSSGSCEGTGGWRQSYYRPHDAKLDGEDFTQKLKYPH